jgi:hypothetical protein
VVEAEEVCLQGRGVQLKLKATLAMAKRSDLIADKMMRWTQHPFGYRVSGCNSCRFGDYGASFGCSQSAAEVAEAGEENVEPGEEADLTPTIA